MSSYIEIELRAILTNALRGRLLKYMSSLGNVTEINRVMLDYSGENRSRTIVVRVNNGKIEMVSKSGRLSQNIRQEQTLNVDGSNLVNVINFMACLGFKHAMISLRQVYIIRNKEFEYSIRDVISPDNLEVRSTLFELEALGAKPGNEHHYISKLEGEFRNLDLRPLDKSGWLDWVKQTYINDDKIFIYSKKSMSELIESLIDSGYLNE